MDMKLRVGLSGSVGKDAEAFPFIPKKEFRFFLFYLRALTYTTNGEKQNKKRAT